MDVSLICGSEEHASQKTQKTQLVLAIATLINQHHLVHQLQTMRRAWLRAPGALAASPVCGAGEAGSVVAAAAANPTLAGSSAAASSLAPSTSYTTTSCTSSPADSARGRPAATRLALSAAATRRPHPHPTFALAAPAAAAAANRASSGGRRGLSTAAAAPDETDRGRGGEAGPGLGSLTAEALLAELAAEDSAVRSRPFRALAFEI